MSRIHDALKRAEEERENRPSSLREPKAAEFAEAPAAVADLVPNAAEDLAPISPAEAQEAESDLTLDVLKSQVRKFKWTPNAQTMLFFGEENYAAGTEEFRTLRSSLAGVNGGGAVRSLLVTSSLPQEGKSFISSNTAQILARQPDRRVLLIDGDLRWSRLHTLLGAPATPGLTEYLGGEAGELAILQRGPLENLYFIPGGKHSTNPAELIANGRFKILLQRLKPLFDWVVVDSPPAAGVSDARILAGSCDGVLLVVAAGGVSCGTAQKVRDQFKDRRLLGVVLNRLDPRGSSTYKYYDYYQGAAKGTSRKDKRARA